MRQACGWRCKRGRRGRPEPAGAARSVAEQSWAGRTGRSRCSAAHACTSLRRPAPPQRCLAAYQWVEVGYEADGGHDAPAYALGHFIFSGLQVSPFIQFPRLPAQDGQAGGRDARQDAHASPRVEQLHQPSPGPGHRGLPAGCQGIPGRPSPCSTGPRTAWCREGPPAHAVTKHGVLSTQRGWAMPLTWETRWRSG